MLLASVFFLVACESTQPQVRTGLASPSPAASPAHSLSREPSSAPTAAPTSELTFAVIGDFGSGNVQQLSVAARMCAWRTDHPFDLVVTTGDNIYPDGNPEDFEDKFFNPYKCLLDEGVEWHFSLGNHDWATDDGQPELEEPAFGMDGPNYVVRESGVRFVIANSNEMDRAWLREELAAEPGDRWTIVVFHHPVYSPGLHGSTPAFADLPAIFEDYGVDLVLNGHDHFYSVTKPENGIRYVVTGGGGAQLYPCLPSAQKDVCALKHHFLYVETGDEKLSVVAVPTVGPPFDRFTTGGLD
jgi:Calcineurin-like phosphoesterase